MIRLTLTALTALALAGCTDGPAPTAAKAKATPLTAGMTEEQVFEVMGPEASYVRNPENWDQACVSYGAEGDYVHAVFENGVLVNSSSGNPVICSYEG